MAIYAFRLKLLNTVTLRSRHTDDDVITFGVMVNEQQRGQCAGRSPAFAGGTVDLAFVPATTGTGAWNRDFIIGPVDLEPDDMIRVFYSVTNVSDAQIADPDAEKYQIKIMDAMLTAAAGALLGPAGVIGGVVGQALASALKLVPSPVAAVLGWEPNGPCNGVVLAGTVDLSGAGLERLDYVDHWSLRPAGPPCRSSPITRHYDDQATHNVERCGAVAQTDLTFEVLRIDAPVSVRAYAALRGVVGAEIGSLRMLDPSAGPTSVRHLVGLQP